MSRGGELFVYYYTVLLNAESTGLEVNEYDAEAVLWYELSSIE